MPYKLKERVLLAKKVWKDSEIDPAVPFAYTCPRCQTKNVLMIGRTEPGRIIKELYHENDEFSRDDFIKNGAAFETDRPNPYYDLKIANNLPALYAKTSCTSCDTKYILVYGIGEGSRGDSVLNISGVWEIEKT